MELEDKLTFKQGIKFINFFIKNYKINNTVLIGITGASGSGKTYFSKELKLDIISMDDYYKGIDMMDDNNFDNPNAIDFNKFKKDLKLLKLGKVIKKPIYDFKIHKRVGHNDFSPSKYLIVEGLFVLDKRIIDLFDILIFIEVSKETCLNRRIKRDIDERGRTKKEIIKQFNLYVWPSYLKYIEPKKKLAKIVKNENSIHIN
jgi:uridine kinase